MSSAAQEIVQPATSQEVVEFKPFDAQLAEFKARYAGVVYDLTDPKQEKQARSDRLAIGKVVAELDRVHAAVKAPLLEQTKLLDGERKRIKDDLQGIQETIKSQIAAHEQAIADAEAALQARVAAIRALGVFSVVPTVPRIEAALAAVKAIVIDHEFEHLINAAGLAKLQTMENLERLLADTQLQEARQEEARKQREAEERQRQAEAVEQQRLRDEELVRQATERAKAEAEAEIERARQEERERARLEAERAAGELEKQAREAAEKAARDREAAEDKQHQLRVHGEIEQALKDYAIVDQATAFIICEAIQNGKIPNVSIKY